MVRIFNDMIHQRMNYLLALCLLVQATISSLSAQQYDGDGIPAGIEEEIRWLVNRGRYDSATENATQGTSYADIPSTSSALAPNQLLTLAGRHHSEDMARNNAFQHETVPGSTYYNSVTQPSPWDRMEAEGYNWSGAGENIAAGYTSALAVYVGWWKSTGHRINMYKASHREIGNGHFEWASSTYRNYYTMELASSRNRNFLTGTLFNDSNGNNRYEPSEAASDVRVSLMVNDTVYPQYDISTSVGNFAVPIQSIAKGTKVRVILSNTTNSIINLSIPTSYSTFAPLRLTPGESMAYGQFTLESSENNVGLREITPIPQKPPLPALMASVSRLPSGVIDHFILHFQSTNQELYTLEHSTDAKSWQVLETGIIGNGNALTRIYPVIDTTEFFRLRRE